MAEAAHEPDGVEIDGEQHVAEQHVAERHASWLELFFDLVVVVAVAQLAHRLHEHPTAKTVAICALLYYAVWSVWTSFTIYTNVVADRARTRSLMRGMFGIAVMAAAIPHADGDRGVWFVAAYLSCRLIASGVLQRTGQVVTSWPVGQAGAGAVPWIISIWADPPVRFWLWGLGIALDLFFAIMGSRNPDRLLEEVQERQDRQDERRRGVEMRRQAGHEPSGTGRARLGAALKIRAVPLHTEHLWERLGLFVIIVLGESVAQVVDSAAESDWKVPLAVTAIGGFVLLICLWWLILQNGLGALPDLGHMEARLAMPSHYAITAGITAMSAGLGAVAAHPDHAPPMGIRWVLCGGVALYLATGLVGGLLLKASWRWMLGWAVPSTLVALAVGVWGGELHGSWIVLIMLAVVAWQVAYRPISRRYAFAA
ncbi:low temperature requirement protein A [Actinomadura barringtoniae]|uniref:Low temperature requirement protein A n=1 Tax=Actinomadura barringtoniae TaxID=1427535 RepID=A0A939T894_9ACTN|nr:low temperature requirement protein A [Actinomadura barringtoniae]MBO2446665.1 low temperature requirement protein A [Actinomadura barringtoniae]